MTASDLEATRISQLSDRVDTAGWGVLLLAIGALSLVPVMPDGAWLVGVGLVMLGSIVVRAWLGLPRRDATVVIGIVALAIGVFTVAGLTTEVVPLVLILLGLTLVVSAMDRRGSRIDAAGTPRL
jgi:hypothetical protein